MRRLMGKRRRGGEEERTKREQSTWEEEEEEEDKKEDKKEDRVWWCTNVPPAADSAARARGHGEAGHLALALAPAPWRFQGNGTMIRNARPEAVEAVRCPISMSEARRCGAMRVESAATDHDDDHQPSASGLRSLVVTMASVASGHLWQPGRACRPSPRGTPTHLPKPWPAPDDDISIAWELLPPPSLRHVLSLTSSASHLLPHILCLTSSASHPLPHILSLSQPPPLLPSSPPPLLPRDRDSHVPTRWNRRGQSVRERAIPPRLMGGIGNLICWQNSRTVPGRNLATGPPGPPPPLPATRSISHPPLPRRL
ncbi:unnamed protein product [Diplocarpon coronariae]